MSFKVKALFEYTSPHEDDLNFPVGQVITVIEEEDDDWYTGEYVDESGARHEGIFPRNFVEKFEPVAPPRPTRSRSKKEPGTIPDELGASAGEPVPAPFSPRDAVPEATAESIGDLKPASPPPPTTEQIVTAVSPVPQAPEPKFVPSPPRASAEPVVQSPKAASVKSGPPPAAPKPTSSSFRDRIAAFNKPAAPPIAPFKPSGLGGPPGSSSFVRKPFVAPPPKGNTYVPVQRNTPVTPVYRREEDPEIREREAENTENAQKTGLLPSDPKEGEDGDQPKPMSLKERMALLQRQQQEQAQRHAEAAAKKEKPKRPAKPRVSSLEAAAESPDEEGYALPSTLSLERRDTVEIGGRASIDDHPPRLPAQPRRKYSKGQEPRDGNEADMSGAGETTEDQEDITEREDKNDKPRRPARISSVGPTQIEDESGNDEKEGDGEDDEDDEDDEDEETKELRRKEALRARMARLGGGVGMPGMFGMPMPGAAPSPSPTKKKKTSSSEKRTIEESQPLASSSGSAPPVPMMIPIPGMGVVRKSEDRNPAADEASNVAGSDEVDEGLARSPPAVPASSPGACPPIPGGRPAPPPVPTDSRPTTLAHSTNTPGTGGSESDDELSGSGPNESWKTTRGEEVPASRAPPPLPPVPKSPGMVTSPSFHQPDDATPLSPSSKRASRPPPPPPVPGFAPAQPAQSRAPPPPPPGSLPRTSTSSSGPLSPRPAALMEDNDEEVTEYEGDYDTDIASSVPHKPALKPYGRESSLDDSVSVASHREATPSLPPPMPSAAAPRAVPPPPPIPKQPATDNLSDTRRSVDAPRAAPPPPPPPEVSQDEVYDPYNYRTTTSPRVPAVLNLTQAPPPLPAPRPVPVDSEYDGSEQRALPPGAASRAAVTAPRGSLDLRAPSRRSVDLLNRPSTESGFVANDIELAPQSGWWLLPKGLPPQLQGRKDIFFESEESQSTERGAKMMVTRDIFVLFQDYSQTVITARFDPQDINDVELQQRHEGPPRSLRQDQLEDSYDRFGRPLADAVAGKKDTVVGDGTPQALVYELLRPFKDALPPVGTRAYGALVYSNLANASTTQTDQIRAGDVISIRNAKFQGKHGPMHAKYSMDVGKPDHVGIVAEWDGTKKKIRAWEQGRESKKVKQESFKLDDLRSGEVKIWRVMPRSWVGWEGQN